MPDPVPSPAQVRAARALLDWPQEELARASGVAARTIGSFEARLRKPIAANLAALRRALEEAGVEFLDGDGVRLRPSPEAPA